MDNLLFILVLLTTSTACITHAGRVVYAVNAGGGSHIDSHNIKYLADPLDIGVSSDYGLRQSVQRVPANDHVLYQTERWHGASFSYEIPVKEDGDYVLVLKFAEVYFYAPNQKVFNVQLNDQHVVLENLDIFSEVGHSIAHDEIIPLSIKKGKLSVNGEFSTFNGILKLELVKGSADNPKICAFYLMKGTVEDVPKLPEKIKREPEDTDEDAGEDEELIDSNPKSSSPSSKTRDKLKSGPVAADPYADDNSSYVMPIMIAFAIFIPSLLILCRL